MAKKKAEQEDLQPREKPRFYITLVDVDTEVTIQAGTNEISKFTKTDLMKMVAAFKTEVKREEKVLDDRKKQAEKSLNESDKRGDSNS